MRVSAWQSPARYPLTSLLGQGSHLRVLRVLSASDQPLGTGPLAAGAGLTPQGTRLALEDLVAEGLVKALGAERTRLYHLDDEHPLGRAVRQLFVHETQGWQRLHAELRKLLARDKTVLAAWNLEASPQALQKSGLATAQPAFASDGGTRAPALRLILLREKGQNLNNIRTQIQGIATASRVEVAILAPEAHELQAWSARMAWRKLLLENSTSLKGLSLEKWLDQNPESPQPGLF